MLHAKTMTVDDSLALVGSGNFDIRSFYLNFELNMLSYGPKVTATPRFAQRGYVQQSTQLDLQQRRLRRLGLTPNIELDGVAVSSCAGIGLDHSGTRYVSAPPPDACWTFGRGQLSCV